MLLVLNKLLGATVDLTSPSEGETTWTVQQKDAEFEIEFPEDHARINFDYGPVKVFNTFSALRIQLILF